MTDLASAILELVSITQTQPVTQRVASLYLIEDREAEPITITKYDTLDDLVERLRSLSQSDGRTRVYVFQGDRLVISKPPLRYLILADGTKVPLFNVPETPEPDPEPILSAGLLDPGLQRLYAAPPDAMPLEQAAGRPVEAPPITEDKS